MVRLMAMSLTVTTMSWNVPTGEFRFSKYSSTHIRVLKSENSSKSYFYLFI